MKKMWMILMAAGFFAGISYSVSADELIVGDVTVSSPNGTESLETIEDIKSAEAQIMGESSDDITKNLPPSSSKRNRNRSGHYFAEEETMPYKMKQVGRSVLLYIPNLLLDVTDLISFEVGAGPIAALDLKMTDFCRFGFINGTSYFAGYNFNRQLGYGRRLDEEVSFGFYSARTIYVDNASSLVRPVAVMDTSFEPVTLDLADYREGNLDPWAIGVNVGLGVDFSVYFHPMAIPDLIAGIFFLDLNGDAL